MQWPDRGTPLGEIRTNRQSATTYDDDEDEDAAEMDLRLAQGNLRLLLKDNNNRAYDAWKSSCGCSGNCLCQYSPGALRKALESCECEAPGTVCRECFSENIRNFYSSLDYLSPVVIASECRYYFGEYHGIDVEVDADDQLQTYLVTRLHRYRLAFGNPSSTIDRGVEELEEPAEATPPPPPEKDTPTVTALGAEEINQPEADIESKPVTEISEAVPPTPATIAVVEEERQTVDPSLVVVDEETSATEEVSSRSSRGLRAKFRSAKQRITLGFSKVKLTARRALCLR
jgi:hypothetical protein